ncbi:MAG: PilZ domain-containing protein [Rhodanobacteraceae bacterium]|nr:PilZ domain-containing protein [Rhodanobacteraceae bacterium]MBK7042688.1 PilZ domain-containing protein [Rhodanobacteraceae bacterium]MBP9155564.1 PilZ domain-containing protein [Xanthomonadales bacterium]HQW81990.1 PilZ domain-containing protein [Pseudomonadota bacterium]
MSNSSDSERRRFHRFRFEGSVKLYSDRAMWDAELIDISLKGALTTRPADWSAKPNAMHRIELRIGDGLKISMGASAAHLTDDSIGFRWEKIDLDSFTQLKRLIELNLGDPERLNAELSALG